MHAPPEDPVDLLGARVLQLGCRSSRLHRLTAPSADGSKETRTCGRAQNARRIEGGFQSAGQPFNAGVERLEDIDRGADARIGAHQRCMASY